MEVTYDDEDLGLILFSSLLGSYANFRDTIQYSHDTLTMNDVYEALQAKEQMKQMVSSEGSTSNREALSVCGRTQKKSNNSYRDKSLNDRSNSRDKDDKFTSIARRTLISYLSVLN